MEYAGLYVMLVWTLLVVLTVGVLLAWAREHVRGDDVDETDTVA